LQKNLNRSQIDLSQRSDRQGNGNVRVTKIQILDENGLPVQAFQTGQVGVIRMELENVLGVPVDSCGVNIGISDEYGARQCLLSNEMSERVLARIPSGRSHANFTIKPIPLLAGQYSLTVFLASQGEIIDWVIDAGLLSVVEGDYFGTGRLPPSGQGRIVIPQRFEVMNEEGQG